MDVSRVLLLREVLAGSGWVERTRSFARMLRSTTRDPGGLLLVGTPEEEPWHLAAHLGDEARLSGRPQLAPTLVRYAPPADAPQHLSVTLSRLEAARRGETVFVVAEDEVPAALLERAWDARQIGATVLSIDTGQSELNQVAHESLIVPGERGAPGASLDETAPLPAGYARTDTGLVVPAVSFDAVQHLVSVAAGEASATATGRRGFRDKVARALEAMTGPRSDTTG
jgi:hypothetical protein